MEVSLVQKLNCGKKQYDRISQFSQSPIESRSIEPFCAADEPDADDCEHFTIRGYVAEVRKRDTKICWPFVTPGHHISDKEASSLPPLFVSKFKRWDCQECLRKTIASGAAVANGEADVKGKSDSTSFLGDDTVASQPSCFQQLREENFEGRLDDAKSSRNVNNGCHKSGSVIKELIKEGSQVYRSSHNYSKQAQNRCREFPSLATKGEECHQGEKGERRERKKHVGTALVGEVAPIRMLYVNSKVNELTHEACAEMPDELHKSVSSNVDAFSCLQDQEFSKSHKMKKTHVSAIKKCVVPLEKISSGDLQTAMATHICDPGSLHMDKSNNRAPPDVNVCLSDNSGEGQDYADQLCSSIVQHKKARKVRFLNDIIRSEELRMSQEVYMSEAETRKCVNDNDQRVDASKGKRQELDNKSPLSAQKIITKRCKRRKRGDSSESEEEAPSLMHWLRKVSKKSITTQEDAKTKNIKDTIDDISTIIPNASQRKGMNLNFEGFRTRGEDKANVDMQQCNVPQAHDAGRCVFPQQDCVTGKGQIVRIDVQSEKDQPKSTGIIEMSTHHALEIKDSTSKKTTFSQNKKKACQVENGESLQVHWLRDSSSTDEDEIAGDFQRKERAMKKQKVVPISEQESLDDLPMDIVELLAKNLHERRLMTAAASTEDLHKLPKMVETRDGNHGILLDFSRGQGNKFSDEANKRSYLQKYDTNNTGNVALNAYRRNVDCNANHHIDLNEQEPLDTGFRALPRYCNYPTYGVNVPITNSRTDRVEMQASESCHSAKRNSSWDAFRSTHDGFSVLLNERDYATNVQKVNNDFNWVDHDFNHAHIHSHDPYIQKNLKTVPYKYDNRRSTNSTGAIVLDRKERVETSMLTRTYAASTSFIESGKECHSTTSRSSDLYTNETISAMHLLRLIDPTACSGEPVYATSDINHIGYFHKSDFCDSQLYQLRNNLSSIEKCDQDQNRVKPCKPLCPLRPLPRFGVLGPLLQKEITAHSNKCETAFGFTGGCSKELTPLKLGGLQVEVSQSASHVKVPNSQAFASGCESSKHFVSDAEYPAHIGCSTASLAACDDMDQVGISYKDRAVQPLETNGKMEICTINRNPADFAIVDEESEFMIRFDRNPRIVSLSEGLGKPMHLGAQKRQKVMKLSALKGLMRS